MTVLVREEKLQNSLLEISLKNIINGTDGLSIRFLVFFLRNAEGIIY